MAEAADRCMGDLRVQRDTAVALALGRVERRVRPARRAHRSRHIAVVALDLLHADHIPWLGANQPSSEALAFRRSQTVDV